MPELTIHDAGSLDLAVVRVPLGATQGFRLPARPHRHENVEINFITGGDVIYWIAGRQWQIRDGEVGVLWASYPHGLVQATPQAVMTWATIPLRRFFAWGFSTEFFRHLLEGELLIDRQRRAEQDDLLFRGWVEECKTGNSEEAILLLELEARLRRLERNFGTGAHQGVSDAVFTLPEAAVKMASYLAGNFDRPVTLTEVAQAGGLHPNYAANVFKRAFGVTVGAFLAQYRVARAEALLTTTDDSLLLIAQEVGFGSTSRFYERFTRLTGSTPARYRAAHRKITG